MATKIEKHHPKENRRRPPLESRGRLFQMVLNAFRRSCFPKWMTIWKREGWWRVAEMFQEMGTGRKCTMTWHWSRWLYSFLRWPLGWVECKVRRSRFGREQREPIGRLLKGKMFGLMKRETISWYGLWASRPVDLWAFRLFGLWDLKLSGMKAMVIGVRAFRLSGFLGYRRKALVMGFRAFRLFDSGSIIVRTKTEVIRFPDKNWNEKPLVIVPVTTTIRRIDMIFFGSPNKTSIFRCFCRQNESETSIFSVIDVIGFFWKREWVRWPNLSFVLKENSSGLIRESIQEREYWPSPVWHTSWWFWSSW